MKRIVLALTIVLVSVFAVGLAQNVEVASANPYSVPYVPDIRISYPLTSNDGYVNTNVDFEVYVNLLENQTLTSISYSLDGQPQVNLSDLKVTSLTDQFPVYINGRIPDVSEKFDYKKYTISLRLEDLPEGSHTLTAYALNMSASQTFTVSSRFIIAELKTLSPTSQTYSEPVPLTFTVNGEIQQAHYYVYKGDELISNKTINGNTTLDQLPEGNYDLYLFVTTELGKTSEAIHFSVSNGNSNYMQYLPAIAGLTVPLVLGVGLIIFLKKHKH